MATNECTASDCGIVDNQLTPAMGAFTPRDYRAFREVNAALERIAEAAAAAGNSDDADWSGVYAAMLDGHRLIDEL